MNKKHGPQIEIKQEFQHYFDSFDLQGSFIMYDLNKGSYLYVNPDQKDIEFPPASTFKICNSLIGLETGVIEDENFVIPWDSVQRNFSAWNQDINLSQAIKYSVVWYYQELARRVGEQRMQEWITKSQYGNEEIGGGIDQFWLRGDLRITPQQQIEFLKRLYRNELPFSNKNQETVKRIMIVEETPDYTMHAKTGWALVNNTGWYIGYVEKEHNVYFFVTCVQGNDFNMENFGTARIEITRNILIELGII
ncbi:MAG: class D beta-lactamase [Bacteroidales bacterium]